MKRASPGIAPLVTVDRRAKAPLHRQLYDGFRDAIVERRLRGGQRLPSSRRLAAELGISRIPVVAAFEQLAAEGYFEGRVGSGTFVARTLPDEAPPRARQAAPRAPSKPAPRVVARAPQALLRRTEEPWLSGTGPFRTSETAVDAFPFAAWSTLVSRHGRNPLRSLLKYGDPMGYRPFREAVAEYLRTARAVRCEADQIMAVSGSQQALEITARVLLDRGSRVWVEDPGYGGARDVLTMAGARLVPVPVDESGMDVAAGIALCPRPRAVHVTPSHQYPLGVTMPAARRLQLLEWAGRTGVWIIEDDYDSEFRYDSRPIASLQGLDREARVVYIGTFSKVLFPALRVGYLVIPPDLVPRFSAVREAMDIFAPTLHQAVLTDFIGEGHFARHIRRMRVLYGERRRVLARALESELGATVEVLGDPAGMHLTAALPRGSRDHDVATRAAKERVWAMPLSECYLGTPRPGLILGYGGAAARDIAGAVRTLRRVLESR